MECVCEMCMRRKATERHHIIPKVASIPRFDIERDDNIINLCSVCHSRLTPTSALTSYSLRKIQDNNDRLSIAKKSRRAFAQEVVNRINDEMPCVMYASEAIEIMLDVLQEESREDDDE